MKRFWLPVLVVFLALACGAIGQLQTLYNGVPGANTVMTQITNSPVVLTVGSFPKNTPNSRTGFALIDNRGPGIIVWDFTANMTQSILNVNGSPSTQYIGHCMVPQVGWETPAGMQYDGPLSAVCTNGTSVVAFTTGFINQP